MSVQFNPSNIIIEKLSPQKSNLTSNLPSNLILSESKKKIEEKSSSSGSSSISKSSNGSLPKNNIQNESLNTNVLFYLLRYVEYATILKIKIKN